MYEQLFLLQEQIFKVLANSKRLEIVQLLSNQELSVNEMVFMLGLPQANLSQHLSLLRQGNVVETRREGVTIYYRLSDARIADACQLVKSFLQEQNRLNPEAGQFLSTDEDLYPITKDVVCGMRISISRAGGISEYNDNTYYFCASGCKQTFDTDTAKYMK